MLAAQQEKTTEEEKSRAREREGAKLLQTKKKDMNEKPPKGVFTLPGRLWRGTTFVAHRN